MNVIDPGARYEVRHDDDALDAKLTCAECWNGDNGSIYGNPGYLCDIEHGDSLRTLVDVVNQHEAECHSATHEPRNWFTRGVHPSCTCGFTPRNNIKLNQHWADLGFRWIDVRSTLRKVSIEK